MGKTALATSRVPIDSVRPDPHNARRHPERNLSALVASFKEFGQQKPILVDRDGVIVAGNGWWQAMKLSGAKEIEIVRTTLSGAERTKFAIVDNRTAELSEWDDEILAEQLAALGQEFKDSMLFDDDGSESGGSSRNPPEAPDEFQKVDDEISTEYRCPSCRYEWSGKPKGGE